MHKGASHIDHQLCDYEARNGIYGIESGTLEEQLKPHIAAAERPQRYSCRSSAIPDEIQTFENCKDVGSRWTCTQSLSKRISSTLPSQHGRIPATSRLRFTTRQSSLLSSSAKADYVTVGE